MTPKEFLYLILGKDFSNWLRPYHILDWLIVILVHIIALFLDSDRIDPRVRYLPSNSSEVGYPAEKDIISFTTVFVLSWIVPVVIIGLFQIWIRSRHDFHHGVLGLWAAFGFTYLFTCIIKLSVGRYRPDYNAITNNGIDARLSFPSGHSSASFSSAVYMSLYIIGKLRVYRQTSGSMVSKMAIVLIPLVISTYVAVSRTVDYHHNFSDILAGSLLGAGLGMSFYFMHYPSLFSDECAIPKSHHLEQIKKAKEMKVIKVEMNDNRLKDSLSNN